MKNKKKHIKLEDFEKQSKKNNFKISNNYFEGLQKRVESKLNNDSSQDLLGVEKKNNFDLPVNYHSNLKSKLEKDLVNVKSSKSNLRILYYSIVVVAAIFIGMILLNMPSMNSNLMTENTKSFSVSIDEFQNLIIEDMDSFDPVLAMLEEEDSEYNYIFNEVASEVTTVEDIQDVFIDEWEDSEYDY